MFFGLKYFDFSSVLYLWGIPFFFFVILYTVFGWMRFLVLRVLILCLFYINVKFLLFVCFFSYHFIHGSFINAFFGIKCSIFYYLFYINGKPFLLDDFFFLFSFSFSLSPVISYMVLSWMRFSVRVDFKFFFFFQKFLFLHLKARFCNPKCKII